MLETWRKGPSSEAEAAALALGGRFARLKLGLSAGIKLALNTDDTTQVFYLARALDQQSLPRLRDRLMQTESGRSLLARRPAIDRTSVDFDALRRLPEDSLGGAYVCMLDRNGLTPDIFQRPPGLPEDLAWVGQRIRQTHDLWHVLTGLSTDVTGEIALQAFTYAQLRLRLSRVLAVHGVLIFTPTRPRTFGLARKWYARGQKASFLLEVPWEQRWAEPLENVRRELGLAA